jgi:signal transduction histidine kinase
MRKLFGKLLSYQVIVLVVGYVFVVIGANAILENYFVEQKTALLLEHARDFQEVYTGGFETGTIDIQKLQNDVVNLRRFTGADLMLVNSSGQLVVSSGEMGLEIFSDELTDGDFDLIFGGQPINKKIYAHRESGPEQVLVVGYPVIYDDEAKFALVLTVPMPEIKKNIKEISTITLSALVIAGAIGVILLTFFMAEVKREIDELREAVDYVTEGNYDKKIKVRNNDELGELAHRFNEMAAELGKLEEAKRRFISDLTHDLRSPLTSISGYTKGILDGTIPHENQDRYLKIVYDESIRLSKMINDVLDLSRLESGKMLINKSDFDINQIIVETLDKFEQRIINKNIRMDIVLHEEKVFAHGDAQAIGRVVYNLIDNAVKFIEPEATLFIRTEIKQDKLLVGIQNTAPYIKEEQLKNIWNRFYKMDNSRGQQKNSSGLGLSIIKEIVKAHDEKIEVYSNEDIGVLFVFSLPAKFLKK